MLKMAWIFSLSAECSAEEQNAKEFAQYFDGLDLFLTCYEWLTQFYQQFLSDGDKLIHRIICKLRSLETMSDDHIIVAIQQVLSSRYLPTDAHQQI
jgi:hypothetical protein